MIETIQLEKAPLRRIDIRRGHTTSAGVHAVDLSAEKASFVPPGMFDDLRVESVRHMVILAEHDDAAHVEALPTVRETSVRSLPGEPYALLKAIPVKIEQVEEGDFLAIFEEANIAMGGENEQEAFQNLIAEILDAFEDFSAEQINLGPEPARQLAVLKEYLLPRP